jgi:hypothetical protein
MFKSKHSGWTWDLKRTPFGGGGNPISDLGNSISDAFSGAGDALASIDPGPAIGGGLAELDKGVNNAIPGGWITVGALAAGGLAIAYAPEVMAFAEANGLTPAAASTELGMPGVNAVTGETIASGTGLTGGAGGSTGLLTGGTTGGLTIPGGAAIAVDPAIAAGTGAGIGGTGAAVGGGVGTIGGLSSALPSVGSVGGAGAGLSAELAPGTIIGTGANGGAIGGTYLAGANGMVATDLLGNAIPASSVGMGGIESTAGLSAVDIATNAKRLQTIAKLLGTGGSTVSGRAAPTAQQWTTQAGQNLAQATPQQFGGLYEMNKNPFTFSNPLAAALKGKDTTGYDVSGTGGTALNTTAQASNLAKLLA